jgi:hypothetical protein
MNESADSSLVLIENGKQWSNLNLRMSYILNLNLLQKLIKISNDLSFPKLPKSDISITFT